MHFSVLCSLFFFLSYFFGAVCSVEWRVANGGEWVSEQANFERRKMLSFAGLVSKIFSFVVSCFGSVLWQLKLFLYVHPCICVCLCVFIFILMFIHSCSRRTRWTILIWNITSPNPSVCPFPLTIFDISAHCIYQIKIENRAKKKISTQQNIDDERKTLKQNIWLLM